MKKLYAYSWVDDQSPASDDDYVELEPTVEAINKYWATRNSSVGDAVYVVISYDTGFKVYEEILNDLDIEPALYALNNS